MYIFYGLATVCTTPSTVMPWTSSPCYYPDSIIQNSKRIICANVTTECNAKCIQHLNFILVITFVLLTMELIWSCEYNRRQTGIAYTTLSGTRGNMEFRQVIAKDVILHKSQQLREKIVLIVITGTSRDPFVDSVFFNVSEPSLDFPTTSHTRSNVFIPGRVRKR